MRPKPFYEFQKDDIIPPYGMQITRCFCRISIQLSRGDAICRSLGEGFIFQTENFFRNTTSSNYQRVFQFILTCLNCFIVCLKGKERWNAIKRSSINLYSLPGEPSRQSQHFGKNRILNRMLSNIYSPKEFDRRLI